MSDDKKWDVDYTTPGFNPLAIGIFCSTCGTRLQVRGDATGPCPFGPHEDPFLNTTLPLTTENDGPAVRKLVDPDNTEGDAA